MKILLVEDNGEMRRLLKSMLAEIADEIYEASDGIEALELYSAVSPEWILMDVFIKPGDGFATASAIMKINPAAQIIFISNHTDKRTRLAAKSAGGTVLFGKDDLLNLIEFLNAEKRKTQD